MGVRLSIHGAMPSMSKIGRVISVTKYPGAMALTRTLRSAHSTPSSLVSCTTAPLAA